MRKPTQPGGREERMPPKVSSSPEELARDLHRVVSGEVSWGLGSRNARLVLATLGYGLTVSNAELADKIIHKIATEMGYAEDVDVNALRPSARNALMKEVDKHIRQEIKSEKAAIPPLSDVLGSRGKYPDFHAAQIIDSYGYRFGPGGTEKVAMGTVGGVNPPHDNTLPDDAFDRTLGSLADIHRQNRLKGRLRPEYEADVRTVADAFQRGFNLEKPQGSSLHHLIQFMKESPKAVDDAMMTMLESHFHSFVIEHNWAAAFDKSEDFEGGEINLPFDFTCFEFRVNGLRILVPLGTTDAGKVVGCLVSGVNRSWYINNSKLTFTPDGRLIDDEWEPEDTNEARVVNGFLHHLGRQIRAVCIMLDAGVARGDVVEPSPGLAKQRKKQGKSPLKPYHVVSLIRKNRGHHDRGDGTGTHKRLHWRRGHYRHFQQPTGQVQYTDGQGILRSKTWIHWQLIGDPDLGFVDKHYKL